MVTAEAALRAVELTMRRAQLDGTRDLQQGHARGLGAAQEKARRLVNTGRPGATSEHARYDPAARLLREWYLRVHTAFLDNGLGRLVPTPGAAAVEETAALVARIRTGPDPLGPFRATAYLLSVARTDATAAVLAVYEDLRSAAPDRAASYLAHQGGLDTVRGPILRHWYQRCYLATVHAELGLQQPLQAVTAAEAGEVAASVEHGQFRRIIGVDGIPLVTAHGTVLTEADRRLAAGEVRVVPPPVVELAPTYLAPLNRVLRVEVTRSWNLMSRDGRAAWAEGAGVPDVPLERVWDRLPGGQQSALIARWLDTHQGRYAPSRSFSDDRSGGPTPPLYAPFMGGNALIPGPPETAAAEMFNQTPHPVATRSPAALLRASFPEPAHAATRASSGERGSDRRPRGDPERGPDLQR